MKNHGKITFPDKIIFIIIFIIPYMQGGPWNWMYRIPFLGSAGPGFLAFLFSLYIWLYSMKKGLKSQFKLFSNLIWIAAAYTVVKLIQTMLITGVAESLTIYRKNYIYLLSFALISNYISNLSIERLQRIWELIFKWCIPLTIIYFMQCTGIPIFTEDLIYQSSGGIDITRNILGFPPIVPVILTCSFVYMIYTYKKKWVCLTVLLLIACFISYTRNVLISGLLAISMALLLYSFKYGIRENYKLLGYGAIVMIGLTVFASNSLSYWNNLIDSTFNVQLEKGIGTYAIRQELIEFAVRKIEINDCVLTGMGYIRDAAKGEYSLVLGGDTYVAPILWCEGAIGMILRCIPIVVLLFRSIKLLRHSDNSVVAGPLIVIIASIISQIPNYVQTNIFMNYCFVFAQLYMLFILASKYNEQLKTQDA